MPKREAEKIASSGLGVVKGRSSPAKHVAHEPFDLPVCAEWQLSKVAHAGIVYWRKARQERSRRIALYQEPSTFCRIGDGRSIVADKQDLVRISWYCPCLQVSIFSDAINSIQERSRPSTGQYPEPSARVLCHRETWRSDPPVGTASPCKELSMP
jgi:hypothetical protein